MTLCIKRVMNIEQQETYGEIVVCTPIKAKGKIVGVHNWVSNTINTGNPKTRSTNFQLDLIWLLLSWPLLKWCR